MALPDTAAVKRVLRIQHAGADAVLGDMLARATGLVATYVHAPLAAVPRTFVDEACTRVAYGVVTKLLIPVAPVKAGTVVVKDADDAVVDATTYSVDLETGIVRAKRGESFGNGPYTIDAEVGLAAHPEYAERIEPVLAQAIIDTVVDFYKRSNPAAQAEGAGGGVYTQWQSVGLPERVEAALAPLRPVGIA